MIFAAVAILIANFQASAQTCTCPGTEKNRFSGGDSKPLTWRFVTKLVKPGTADLPAWICYEKSVVNKSMNDVRNVRWEVANYFRYLIPANSAREYCPDLPGEMKTTTANGPLFHGVTSENYETTVRQPKDGWFTPSTETPIKKTETLNIQADRPPLVATFLVDLPGRDGPNAKITFVSAAYPESQTTTFDYELKNSGSTDVSIAADLPFEMSKEIPIAQKGILVKAGDSVRFKSVLKSQPKPRRCGSDGSPAVYLVTPPFRRPSFLWSPAVEATSSYSVE